MNDKYYGVIMAGGVGSRFWPLSKIERPKQFIDILGTGKSLLRQTFERYLKLCKLENIFIVTHKDYEDIVKKQIPEISCDRILLEPMRKNTAACVEYANFKIKQINPDAIVSVAPSDHIITQEEEFIRVMKKSYDFVAERNTLLTLGIEPNRVETAYGYIQAEKMIKIPDDYEIFKVKTFAEKPNYELAKLFYETGEFYWNSGIFIWSLASIINAYKVYMPELHQLFQDIEHKLGTEEEAESLEYIYDDIRNISIDYGIMEHAENVYVLLTDFGWSDLGNWQAMYEHLDTDENGNIIHTGKILQYDVKNSIINISKDKLVVIEGLEDYLVVETDDILFIGKRKDGEYIKRILKDVKFNIGEEYI